MGYAVDYKPNKSRRQYRTRARRQSPESKAQRKKDIKNVIRWNVLQLEHDTVTVEYVDREQVRLLLRLSSVADRADPTGDHVLQQLISTDDDGYGIIRKPERINGVQKFRRDDLITSLKAWVGLL